ncbi:MAG: hypothetical protein ABWW70_06455 [Thermoproteota archaeon]
MMSKRDRVLDIVDRMPQLNKAAFYSDPKVVALVETLHRRWSEHGNLNEPIDYATEEELEELLELARHYASLSPWEAYKILRERSEGQ